MFMVCAGDMFAFTYGNEKLVLTMLANFMTLRDRADLTD